MSRIYGNFNVRFVLAFLHPLIKKVRLDRSVPDPTRTIFLKQEINLINKLKRYFCEKFTTKQILKKEEEE